MEESKKVKDDHLKPDVGRERLVQFRGAEGSLPGSGFQAYGRTDDRQVDKARQQPVIGDKRKLVADLKDLDGCQDEEAPDGGRPMDDCRSRESKGDL